MKKKPNSCVYQFTPNMCGNDRGCDGCPSSIEERLGLKKKPHK